MRGLTILHLLRLLNSFKNNFYLSKKLSKITNKINMTCFIELFIDYFKDVSTTPVTVFKTGLIVARSGQVGNHKSKR